MATTDRDFEESMMKACFSDDGSSAWCAGSSSDTPEEDDEVVAKQETKQVLRLRGVVIVTMLVTALAVSLGVYFITKGAERAEFETSFDGNAEKVLNSFVGIVNTKLAAIGSIGLSYTAFAENQNTSWPFVTMKSFQKRAASALKLSSALYIGISIRVEEDERLEWEKYSRENSWWIEEGRAYQEEIGIQHLLGGKVQPDLQVNDEEQEVSFEYKVTGVTTKIFGFSPTFEPIEDVGPGPYNPVWLSSPVPLVTGVNTDLMGFPSYKEGVSITTESGNVVIGGLDTAAPGDIGDTNVQTGFFAEILSVAARKTVSYTGDPMSTVYYPIFDTLSGDRRVAAVMTCLLNWKSYFENILPANSQGIVVVLRSACGDAYTYQIDGSEVTPLGFGDLHDEEYDHLGKSASFKDMKSIDDGSADGLGLHQGECPYSVYVYPSEKMWDSFATSTPLFVSLSVAFVLVFTAAMFVVYDRLVERRQKLVLKTAKQSSAIVSSLFPKAFRDRLVEDNENESRIDALMAPNQRLKTFLKGGAHEEKSLSRNMKPIADLFPHSTVLFADIAGFTSWSSSRDPAQVFVLLQAVYQSFDIIAKRLKVFKVETVGDSYVAVTGLPNPQNMHAVIMAKFASMALIKFGQLTKELESTLGPDTSDLGLRIGMHSGPVTAGILRGERSRFQLFGDTVNTASRMESTGIRGKIQCSQATADILKIAQKEHWLECRGDSVEAKGKGVLDSYWVNPRGGSTDPSQSSSVSFDIIQVHNPIENGGRGQFSAKHERLIDWVVDILQERIRIVVSKRSPQRRASRKAGSLELCPANMPLDEVTEVIVLPEFNSSESKSLSRSVRLPDIVVKQLRDYVSTIASTYRQNAFHNFEHACHVTMAVDKFLKRIVAPDLDFSDMSNDKKAMGALESQLYDYTHGINSDPLTLVAIVMSALIHDSDHRGVSNVQLGKEEEHMATAYKNKSIAEQNSLDLAWNLLMQDGFSELRSCLFERDQDALKRFRQVMVNVVLATDIFDKELNGLRKNRWNKAFNPDSEEARTGLRATIVIEHIIQASDVCHTMQHWHVYRKWNQRLFTEMYTAWKAGRMGADPSTFWFQGELSFFDSYIIPLAKKLKDCGVFGVSSDECLNYALQNRAEWEERGEQIVAEMMAEIEETTRPKGGNI